MQEFRHGLEISTTSFVGRLLADGAGISLEDTDDVPLLERRGQRDGRPSRGDRVGLPGFLFDMNRFFQDLLGRFLTDNLLGYTVLQEYQLRGMTSYMPEHNPRRRRAPTPRPDFAIAQGGRAIALLGRQVPRPLGALASTGVALSARHLRRESGARRAVHHPLPDDGGWRP